MLDKALITRADDFGSSHSANQAIYEVSKKGIVKNVSVMACAPYLEEAAEMLGISTGYAYKIIRGLNEELKAKGFRTICGKVPTKYFEEKFYGLTVMM